MERDMDLPVGLCRACTASAISAWRFRQLCLSSDSTWRDILHKLFRTKEVPNRNKMYIYLDRHVSVDLNIEVTEESFNSSEEFNKRTRRAKGIKCPGLKCFDCGKEFSMTNFMDKHLKGSMKRVCNRCARVVPRDKLARHLSVAHDVQVYECDKCYKLFDEIPQLQRHATEHHLLVECQCKVCGHGFKNERSLRAHEYAHTLFDCASCSRSFENRKCFLFHQLKCKKKILTKALYECHDCGVTYTSKPSLKMHIILKHSNLLPYVCKVCGKRSATLAHNKSHEAIHTERTIYSCFCGANMRTPVGYQLHQRIHSGEKPYECEKCGERFLSASRRSDHVKRRHWTPKQLTHKCTKCSATFIRPVELKKHLRKHHSSLLVA